MAITAYNSSTYYSLQIKPDFVADTRAEVESDLATYSDQFVIIADEGNQVFFVQDNKNSTYSLLPAYDLDNYRIIDPTTLANQVFSDSDDIVPGTTEEVAAILMTKDSIIDEVYVSGDGDGYASIQLDGNEIASVFLNRGTPNQRVRLFLRVDSGAVIRVFVRSEATATSHYTSTILYR